MSGTAAIKVDNEKLKKLRDQVVNQKQKIDFERLEFAKKVYDQYADYSPIILRARFFEYLLDHKKIFIDDNLIVGNLAGEPGAFYIYPEWRADWLKEEDRFEIPDEYKELIDYTYDYWHTRGLGPKEDELSEKILGINYSEYIKAGVFSDRTDAPSGVSISNYERAVKYGLKAIVEEAEQKYKELDVTVENRDKFDFYESVIIETNAVIRYANRYSALAKELAGNESDPDRKANLLEIAEITSKVPEQPATTFREALQSHYFVHLAIELEQVGCGVSQGFLGQELQPYYEHDIKEGIIDDEQATFLLENYFIKLNDISYYYGQRMDVSNSGDTAQTISVGGYTPDGRDATASVDYLILDAQHEVRLPQPPLALIYHDKLKPEFVNKAFELVRTGIGMPQFMNANVLIQRSLDAYSRYGASIEDARRSCVYGCVSTAIPGKTAYLMESGYNIVKGLELVINNGVDPLTGFEVGEKTGDFTKFESFEEVYDAFVKQTERNVALAHKTSEIYQYNCSKFLQLPFRSALTDGCLERGIDMWNDGADFAATALIFNTGIDAANSLAAIKKVVFEDKAITLAELKEALDNNFEGYEIIQKLLQRAPKHGNNDEYAEEIARRVYKTVFDAFQKAGGNYFGKYGKPDAYSKTGYNYYGQLSGATPNGRKAKTAFTDGSVSATPGTDVKGPTVLVSSAAGALDTIAFNSGHLNVKLNPAQFKDEEGNQALLALIKGYFDQNGNHIQFNCVDAKVLKDAKAHPDQHRDLVVRVAGFSAFFTRLHPGVQDEIIARTEHDLVG